MSKCKTCGHEIKTPIVEHGTVRGRYRLNKGTWEYDQSIGDDWRERACVMAGGSADGDFIIYLDGETLNTFDALMPWDWIHDEPKELVRDGGMADGICHDVSLEEIYEFAIRGDEGEEVAKKYAARLREVADKLDAGAQIAKVRQIS